ncbi:hypothetical protein NDA13_001796 [Ustilago tritici]|nr:hypothetical protein NDA13_001796 [Ustilago tritici]
MSHSSLRDAAAIASTLCRVAKGVVLSPNGANKVATSTSARPWPRQILKASSTVEKSDAANAAPSQSCSASSRPHREADASLQANPPISRPWPSKAFKAETVPTFSPAQCSTEDVKANQNIQGAVESSASTSAIPLKPSPPELAVTPSTATSSVDALAVKAAYETEHDAPEPRSITPHTITVENVSRTEDQPPATAAPVTKAQVLPEGEKVLKPEDVKFEIPPIREPSSLPVDFEEYDATKESKHVPLRAAKVPSSRLGRLLHYGGLGAGLAFGAAGSLLRASSGGTDGSAPSSMFMSEQNVARLVDKLSTMRGAALKLGQFLSIQETKLLPPQIEQVLLRVQNGANYMPVWQMNKVMSQELGGSDWRERHFKEFEDIPFASASIGQVHTAVLRNDFPDPKMAGQKVAVKVQFPGVLESIDSDLSYLRWLVSVSALLPKGLFLENTLRVLGRELKDECDYGREAEMGRRFGAILKDSSEFEVPKVVDSLCTGKVLTTEMMRGRPLSQASRYPQDTRDRIAQSILNLSLSELFRFRLMQTDPNWSNFLYNERTGKIQLIDFGATREYSKEFMDNWLQMLQAAIAGDYEECLTWSRKVGYLTGEESPGMERAHVDSMIALGEPFRPDAPNPYPFEHQTITDRVKAQIPLMLRERLTPPPQETYSLNRKLSGAFLLCARLKTHVSCRTLFEQIEADYSFGPEPAIASSSNSSTVNASSPFGSFSSEQRRYFHNAFRAAQQQEQTRLERRRYGRNLTDRFPRSKIVISQQVEGPSVSSLEVGDKVESLAAGPTASASMQETPANVVESDSKAGINLSRGATPAEVSTAETQPSHGSSSAAAEDADAQPSISMGPTTIRGIVIPLKPPPPGPEECCMSGCAHCAYDIYAEDLEDFHSRLSSVRNQLAQLSPPVTREEWREDLLGDYPASAESSAGAANTAASSEEDKKERAQREVDRVIGDLDPTMRAFLEMERKMKKQEREKAKQAQNSLN